MSDFQNVLIVEDDDAMRDACSLLLRREGFNPSAVPSAIDALDEIKRGRDFRIVLTDLKMPDMDGIELLQKIKEYDSDIHVVIMTGYGTIRNAVSAMKFGAADYITKPFNKDELTLVLRKITKVLGLENEVSRLRSELREKYCFENIVGQSAQMQQLYDKIASASRSDSNVLICGESGTGKELVAKAIHYHGPRADRPFVPLNCAAIPRELIESELFGHMKGSFTGATSDSAGLFKSAEGGTILLDEITETGQGTQAKLLRALQEKKIRPIGSPKELPIDARVITSTNRDISDAVRDGTIREDLYYRLSVITIVVPPLRVRVEDIPLLAHHFIEKFNGISERKIKGIDKAALETLRRWRWPGNVRELESTIESAFALGKSDVITKKDLPPNIVEAKQRLGETSTYHDEGVLTFEESEKIAIERALKVTGGNKSKAAEMLGISRPRLYKKIGDYNIKVN